MARERNITGHPARFSPSIINCISGYIPFGAQVHDPFAGTGERLGRMVDALALAEDNPFCTFSGTEIEPCFIVDKRVVFGDATDPGSYPKGAGLVIVTSPVYPNGVADHFFAQITKWKRNTYRQAVAALEGRDRELVPTNMGRYGYRGTSQKSKKRTAYWSLARTAVANWAHAEMVILNVSDFMVGKDIEPLVEPWGLLLEENGWKITRVEQVATPRYKNGSDKSRNERIDTEAVIVAVRA
jgi:hypothetical protein